MIKVKGSTEQKNEGGSLRALFLIPLFHYHSMGLRAQRSNMLHQLHCERLHADFASRRSNRWHPAAGSDAGASSRGEEPPFFHLLPLHCCLFSLQPGSPSKSFSSDALMKGFRISALLFVPSPRTPQFKKKERKRLQHANNVNWKPLLLRYLRF